jgi:hypothetical protein
MEDDSRFMRRIVYISVFGVLLLVAGVLFGPWEIDPHSVNLIGLVAQPGGVALGCVIQGWRNSREP